MGTAGEQPGRHGATEGPRSPLPEGGGQQSLAKEGEPLLLAQGIGVNLEAGQPAIQHGRATLRFCHWRTVLRRQPARTRT